MHKKEEWREEERKGRREEEEKEELAVYSSIVCYLAIRDRSLEKSFTFYKYHTFLRILHLNFGGSVGVEGRIEGVLKGEDR